MNRYLIIPLLLLVVIRTEKAAACIDVEAPSYMEVLHSAFQQGSTKELAKYFHQNLQLRLGDHAGKFSKGQAEFLLSDFFKKYPPQEFEVAHNGETSDETRYILGYFSSEGKNFVFLVKGKRDEKGVLKIFELELRIA
ncbi:DUF4783 domain-containing protein [Pleomorphovibrio marinus]|uniref:DUF4783 domain-containing protein n=1 Tax=Pleomorphovibrio marinus TaxID=2164132 RepID=UPI00130084D1|nr:DUF4783 domain-containing protein [Pleomorphovibrio marinus]